MRPAAGTGAAHAAAKGPWLALSSAIGLGNSHHYVRWLPIAGGKLVGHSEEGLQLPQMAASGRVAWAQGGACCAAAPADTIERISLPGGRTKRFLIRYRRRPVVELGQLQTDAAGNEVAFWALTARGAEVGWLDAKTGRLRWLPKPSVNGEGLHYNDDAALSADGRTLAVSATGETDTGPNKGAWPFILTYRIAHGREPKRTGALSEPAMSWPYEPSAGSELKASRKKPPPGGVPSAWAGPALSLAPSGAQVAFFREAAMTAPGPQQIVLAEPQSANLRVLGSFEFNVERGVGMRFSPDGRVLAFWGGHPPGNGAGASEGFVALHLLDASTGASLADVLGGEDAQFVRTHTGTLLAFTQTTDHYPPFSTTPGPPPTPGSAGVSEIAESGGKPKVLVGRKPCLTPRNGTATYLDTCQPAFWMGL